MLPYGLKDISKLSSAFFRFVSDKSERYPKAWQPGDSAFLENFDGDTYVNFTQELEKNLGKKHPLFKEWKSQVEDLVRYLQQNADSDKDNVITFEEMKAVYGEDQASLESASIVLQMGAGILAAYASNSDYGEYLLEIEPQTETIPGYLPEALKEVATLWSVFLLYVPDADETPPHYNPETDSLDLGIFAGEDAETFNSWVKENNPEFYEEWEQLVLSQANYILENSDKRRIFKRDDLIALGFSAKDLPDLGLSLNMGKRILTGYAGETPVCTKGAGSSINTATTSGAETQPITFNDADLNAAFPWAVEKLVTGWRYFLNPFSGKSAPASTPTTVTTAPTATDDGGWLKLVIALGIGLGLGGLIGHWRSSRGNKTFPNIPIPEMPQEPLDGKATRLPKRKATSSPPPALIGTEEVHRYPLNKQMLYQVVAENDSGLVEILKHKLLLEEINNLGELFRALGEGNPALTEKVMTEMAAKGLSLAKHPELAVAKLVRNYLVEQTGATHYTTAAQWEAFEKNFIEKFEAKKVQQFNRPQLKLPSVEEDAPTEEKTKPRTPGTPPPIPTKKGR